VIRHIQPKSFPESAAPFSQAVVDDTYAHLAGVVAADFPEGQAVLGNVQEETKAVMRAMGTMLEELGLSLERVVRSEVHLSTLDDFDEMDRAYREFFELGKFPARTTTESPKLFGGSLVEVTMMARLK
jgi:2-iminobutanoate/2-iminopropanoate deaminase